MNKKSCQQGSLYLGVTLLLLFLTVFMGIVLQQALLFSTLVRKKQEYSRQFYAADALAEYGVAYGLENYAAFSSEQNGSANGKNIQLVFEHWPEQESQSPYSGNITITKQESGLEVQATLLAKGAVVQRISCALQQIPAHESGQPLFQISNWHRE